ncbi:MAG: hypothetical protein NTY09_01000 [bacterium]|nr:hypothetical protein [bacterium]
MSKLILKYFLVVCFCILLVKPAMADEFGRSLFYRFSYNVQIITLGVNYYWKANNVMPSSILELRDEGLLPLNLINPVNEQPLNLNPGFPGSGEVTIEKLDDQIVQVTSAVPGGDIMQANLDSSLYTITDNELDEANRKMVLYLNWAYVSFQKFYNEKGFVPGSIDDLINAGYWPFEGQLNPVTGMPLQFYSTEPGDLNYTFGYKAQVVVHNRDGSVAAISVSPETGDYFAD